jgi:hypothetical protein
MAPQFHLTKDAFALHLFLERLQSLVDVIVANENLHEAILLPGPPSDGVKKEK